MSSGGDRRTERRTIVAACPLVVPEEKGLARHPPLPRAKPPAGLPARRRPPPAAVARLFVHVQILDVLPAEEEVGVDDIAGRDERQRTRRVEELATLDGGGVEDLMVN
jgi:hypothetical protein